MSTNKFVAIKFLTLHASYLNDQKNRYIARFERETQLGSRLDHPNIVRLLDKGVCDDELLYAVFEYVDGLSLKQVLAQFGPMQPVAAAQVMAQILDGLVHAHERGVVHRDIKPANIMLSRTGAKTHVKILDFGISTLVNEARQLDHHDITLTQETMGTPSYSAPEQLRGEPPTFKTDLYVWALVFIECLTAKPTISGASIASIFHQQLSPSHVPLPPAIVGHPLGALLRRALHKKTSERINKASELYHQLMQINCSTLVGQWIAEWVGSANNNGNTQPSGQQLITAEQTLMDPQGISYTHHSERKQITVLCVSLNVIALTNAYVGNNDIDHELIDALLSDQTSLCQDIAIRYGAFHVGTLGDILLFYYGYPNVSDNDARLAARTALEISSELGKRNLLLGPSQGIETQWHIGINTGIIIVVSDNTPLGETANIAMKLASRARPNQILCTDNARLQLASYIEFETAGTAKLGVERQRQPLYALTGERQLEALGFLRASRRSSTFVGRQTELASLMSLVNLDDTDSNGASDEKTEIATHLYGEAGIGKSRLIFEFKDQISGFVHHVAQCLPEHKNNALYPILTMLKHLYSLDNLSGEAAVVRLRVALEPFAQPMLTAAVPILCNWLSLPLPNDLPVSVQTPDRQKQLLFEVLIVLLCGFEHNPQAKPQAKLQRKLVIFEDIHWADPTSIEFVARLIASEAFLLADHVLISTSRQPLPDALNQTGYRSLPLLKLNESQTSQFIVALFDHQPLADNLLDVIVARTDGIALFIEALVNMLIQQKLVHHINGLIDFVSPDKQDQLPNTLRDSLQQKLDTLVYAKETAQLAATIGREFDYDLLVGAANNGEAKVQNDLNELVEAELIFRQRKVSGDHYIFKHALVRDAAYDSIPKKIRQQLHYQLAETLQNDFDERAQQFPHLLGHHWSQALQAAKACDWFMLAGNNAATTFAHNEYISYYSKSVKQLLLIAAVDKLTSAQKEQLVTAYQGIGKGEIALGQHQQGREALYCALAYIDEGTLAKADIYYKIGKSWATFRHTEQALSAYQQAEDCLAQINDDTLNEHSQNRWLEINSARLNLYYALNDVESMTRLIEKISVIVDERGTDIQKAHFLHDQFQLRLRQRRYALDEAGVMLAQTAWELVNESTDRALVAEFTLDHSLALYFNQQYQAAHNQLLNVLAQSKVLSDITLTALCLTYLSITCRHLGQLEQTRNYAEQALEITLKAGFNNYVAAAKANLSWVELRCGQQQKATTLLTQALEIWGQTADKTPYPLQWLGLLLQLEMALTGNTIAHDPALLAIIKRLLDPKQQSLPVTISAPLQQALASETNIQPQCIHCALNAARNQGFI